VGLRPEPTGETIKDEDVWFVFPFCAPFIISWPKLSARFGRNARLVSTGADFRRFPVVPVAWLNDKGRRWMFDEAVAMALQYWPHLVHHLAAGCSSFEASKTAAS
jgi:hypothetical protein